MNKITRLSIFSFFAAFLFAGCTKQENKIYLEDGTAPALTVTQGANVEYVNADKIAITLNWTNPDYQLTTGVSSQDVNYNIQIDTAGSDFSAATQISVSKELSYSITVSQLNDIMQNQLNLTPAIPHTLEIKVTSGMANNSAPLTSNSVQYTSTPYVIPPKVAAPSSGQLFLVGSATEGGWNNPVPTPSQEFTKIDDVHFTLTVTMLGSQEYLFLPVNGDWSHKYACKSKGDQAATGGDFGADLSDNFPGPAADGMYKIDVDFQKGKYTVTKQ